MSTPNVKARITYRGSPEEMGQKFPRILTEELVQLGDHIHAEYIPFHFTRAAASKYGYQPRTGDYNESKQRKKGHSKPLVWSGQLKEDITSSAQIEATQGEGATITMSSGARALNLSSQIGYPNLRNEITSVAPDEPPRWAQRLHRAVTARLNLLKKLDAA